MGKVTGGSVTFGRTVQPAQYESKKAEVTITFAIDVDDKAEDAIEMLDGASLMAQNKALELCGLKPAAAVAMQKVEQKPAHDPMKNVVDAERPGSKASKTTKAKADAPKEDAKTSDADILEVAPQRDTKAEAAAEAAEAEKARQKDQDDDLLGGSTAQPITDKELMDAVTRKMQETNDPKSIKEVRSLFVQPPLGIKDIQADKRPEFLKKIAELKKPA